MDNNKMNPLRTIRLATPYELQQMKWKAEEERNGRLMHRINERYNEIMKYDY